MAKRKYEMSAIEEPTDEYDIQVASEAVKKLYGDEKTADVYFAFKSKERVPAHKNLLTAASDVFDAMFYGPVKEKGDVKIDDASVAGFMEFLRFFYFDKIKLTMANIGDVLNLGHKYNVTECFNLCVRFLNENLTVDNVFEVHNLAVLFEQDDLEAKCEELIGSQTEEILRSANFLQCDQRNLNFILQLDGLSCSETFLFEAVMSWLKSVSTQNELTKEIVQAHLGDSFNEIRFRSMSLDEFVKLMPSYGKLFTADEFSEILQMIQNSAFQPKIFNALPRTPTTLPWNDETVIECDRFMTVANKKYHVHKIETTTFSTNKALLLGYFNCAKIHEYNGSLKKSLMANLTIFRVPSGTECQNQTSVRTVLLTMKTELAGNYDGNRIKLSKPIVIRPEFKYEIQIDIDTPGDYAVLWELKSEVQLQDITVKFHNDSLVNGKAMGLIDELGFNLIG